MKLKFREQIWCFLFRIKFVRLFLFYKLDRYKTKLSLLDNLDLKYNHNVLDFGANNGIISQYIFDKYKCNVEVFEPNPYCFGILQKIFKGNTKVKLHNVAVSNKSLKTKLYLSRRSSDITNMGLSEIPSLEKKKANVSTKNYVYVKCINVEKLFQKFKKIHFLKIDVEGHEYKLLPSIVKNIKKFGKIFCEMHGSSHRPEFKKDYDKWDKKLKKFKNKNFFYW